MQFQKLAGNTQGRRRLAGFLKKQQQRPHQQGYGEDESRTRQPLDINAQEFKLTEYRGKKALQSICL